LAQLHFVPVKAVGTEDGHRDDEKSAQSFGLAEKSALNSGFDVANCGQEKCLPGKNKYKYPH
jgi:hypothetical protein